MVQRGKPDDWLGGFYSLGTCSIYSVKHGRIWYPVLAYNVDQTVAFNEVSAIGKFWAIISAIERQTHRPVGLLMVVGGCLPVEVAARVAFRMGKQPPLSPALHRSRRQALVGDLIGSSSDRRQTSLRQPPRALFVPDEPWYNPTVCNVIADDPSSIS